ncbi:glycine cleavage system H protein [Treponema sp. J25]|uniref:glycine cleavage system protein H n=1 Tax=Treponema sp. J25 TaxID=2094121 RepID=UPI0010525334|nr:glycine cleavage system H protein [Treponema sp. J25]TCW62069.1 glycine cleavage system protein H [Treponema sp. J25]
MHIDTSARYSKEHLWVRKEGSLFVVGLTHHALRSLGDIVYIELPRVAHHYEAGAVWGVIESAKAAQDLIMPLAGTVIAVNKALEKHPEWIGHDCYGKGWIFQLQGEKPEQFSGLLSPEEYRTFIGEF